jgi:hypothetical protein
MSDGEQNIKVLPEKQAGLHSFFVQSFSSGDLIASNLALTCTVSFKPEYWIVVARLSIGYIKAYPSMGVDNDREFKLDSGTLRLPLPNQTLYIEGTTLTGWVSVYALRNVSGFNVSS